MSVAGYFRLAGPDARRILGEVATAVRSWRQVAAEWLGPDEIDPMAPAFAELDAANAYR